MKIVISLIVMMAVFSSCRQAPTHEYPWKPYSQQAVEDSIAHHKPVVIDFFADWCPICHDLDRTLFALPDIQAKLAKVTALRVDATNQDDPNVQALAQQYQVEGLPTIIFLNTHGIEIKNSRLIGLVVPTDFAQAYALLSIFK
jgi:thiol:disulfide interchange protein DsbD